MVEKQYDWANGATLDDHTSRKHKILREYFYKYLIVRCQLPQQSRFRLAVIDGFAGGGRYSCRTAGSPIIFLEELKRATESLNSYRAAHGLGVIEIECLLILNDAARDVVEILKDNVAPLFGGMKQTVPKLHLRIEYLNQTFENAYPVIRRLLSEGHFKNVLFNLDQYGHSSVEPNTIFDIMHSYPSAELFYTFAIQALFAFLQKNEPIILTKQLARFGFDGSDLSSLEGAMSKKVWLGTAEKIVFEKFQTYAPYVSPFSIHNPAGWRYWLIHFANYYRARQVYNNILHDNQSAQAHYGRSGLRMLYFDPDHEGSLYLFDEFGREIAKEQLLEDIPRLISESGDAIEVADFYENIYNMTPAHSDDVHAAIIENPDIEVITPTGGKRRKANTITVNDVIKLKDQGSFFPLFFGWGEKKDDSK